MDTNYTRVIPRDFFNEAKLLKCMGRLALLIHEEKAPCQMKILENSAPFNIALMSEGSLTIMNYPVIIEDWKGDTVICIFKTTYNSKSEYPFFVQHENVDYRVFDEDGNFDAEFTNFCMNLV